jgi:hypothetical protein
MLLPSFLGYQPGDQPSGSLWRLAAFFGLFLRIVLQATAEGTDPLPHLAGDFSNAANAEQQNQDQQQNNQFWRSQPKHHNLLDGTSPPRE